MNTTSSTLKEEIKKNQDVKKKEKFKLLVTIIISNIAVALLCLPSKAPIQPTVQQKIHHPNHQMMVLPIQVMIAESSKENLETLVTIIAKDKTIIAQKAYLHEEVKTGKDTPSFKIEINDSDVVKLSAYVEEGVVAVPYVENKKIKKLSKGSKYEISI